MESNIESAERLLPALLSVNGGSDVAHGVTEHAKRLHRLTRRIAGGYDVLDDEDDGTSGESRQTPLVVSQARQNPTPSRFLFLKEELRHFGGASECSGEDIAGLRNADNRLK